MQIYKSNLISIKNTKEIYAGRLKTNRTNTIDLKSGKMSGNAILSDYQSGFTRI
jgi:hypothetical protein